MRWNFPGDDTIRVSVRGLLRDALGTHMWVGVGFSTEANAMHGADAYVAWLEFNTSRPIMRAVDTYYVPELTISSSNIRLGDQTRFTFVSNIVANNMQEFEFSRPLQVWFLYKKKHHTWRAYPDRPKCSFGRAGFWHDEDNS